MATYYGRKYILLEFRHRLKEIWMAARIAMKSKSLGKPDMESTICIAMIDGEGYHGGLCDRFKGMVSLYAYCKYRHLPFRIKHTYPFKLEDYLLPATYDWRLREDEYTDNPLYSKILYMKGEHQARRLLNLRTRKQIHFYTNRDLLECINDAYAQGSRLDWGKLFRELFAPGPVLKERMAAVRKELDRGNGYVAAVFRFQNLFGDFSEYGYRPMADKEERVHIIDKCLAAISSLRSEHCGKEILVTSDSVTFLDMVSRLEGCHIIPGTMVHMGGNKKGLPDGCTPFEVYMKSFLDFYMLSEAQKIYRISTTQMYPSAFPVYAAKVLGIPFESIIV